MRILVVMETGCSTLHHCRLLQLKECQQLYSKCMQRVALYPGPGSFYGESLCTRLVGTCINLCKACRGWAWKHSYIHQAYTTSLKLIPICRYMAIMYMVAAAPPLCSRDGGDFLIEGGGTAFNKNLQYRTYRVDVAQTENLGGHVHTPSAASSSSQSHYHLILSPLSFSLSQ